MKEAQKQLISSIKEKKWRGANKKQEISPWKQENLTIDFYFFFFIFIVIFN